MASYAEARGRLKHMTGAFFFVGSLTVALLSELHQEWWLSMIWLAAGACVVRSDCQHGAVTQTRTSDSFEGYVEDEADGRAFAEQFLRLSSVIGMTTLASALTLDGFWLGDLFIGVTVWFASMLMIALLCAPVESVDL